MKGFLREKFFEFLICVVVIIVIGYLPFVFLDNNIISFLDYLKNLLSPDPKVLIAMHQVSFWEIIWEPYSYSIIILLASTFLTILCATVLAFCYLLSSSKIKKVIERCLILIESIPDLLLIFASQLFFVWLYKQIGLNIVNIYAYGGNQAYFLPIISMSVVPTLHFFRIMVLFLLDEQQKPYVDFAYSKGLSKRYIIFVHLFRNIIYHLFNHLQSTFLFMISSLLLVEAAFNINGYMSFILKPGVLTPLTLVWWIALMFIPVYFVFAVAQYQVNRITEEQFMKNSPFHSKRFWFGIVFFIGLVFVSCLFTWYGKNLYSNPQMLLKNENGAVSQAAPFNPLLMPPLGSDRSGYNMFFNLIIGAKFTIVFVFGVTLIQMLLGTLLGCLLAYMPFKLQKFVQKVFKVYFYVPAVVWVILFMMPLMLKSQEIGFNQVTVVKQFLILCIIMLPNIIMYINQEINLFMKKDYITSSIVLGARKFICLKDTFGSL
ncbi:ABC transporter permease subunit [Bacillus sp. A17A.1]